MVIVKSNGIATYNFAVVIDDIDMKMTHVIRGEDHIHNTAKQILLYEALGADPPEFAHAALIFDLDRAKLSKRKHGEFVHIDRYRRDGYLPEALVNYLAQMSWTPPNEQEIFTLEEAGAMFDLDRVSKSPAVFDLDRLKWFNQQYITKLPLEKATELAKPYLADYDLSAYSEEEIRNIVESVRSGLHMLSEITPAVDFYFKKKLDISEESRSGALASESSKRVLQKALSLLDTFPWGDHKGCKSVVDALGKELSVKGKELYHPMRIALSGKEKGPDLGSIISILGPTRVKQRIEDGLSLITVAIALAFLICAPTLIG
jgi:nondiscriminating glutamyl-tRNA synthetase